MFAKANLKKLLKMKKVLLLVAVITAISFASCKKDRVCSCIADTAGATADEVTYIKAKKSHAQAACLSQKYTYDAGGTTTTVTITCTLK